jgi:DNA-directed RNA polymerase subunit RPC12/RpoP
MSGRDSFIRFKRLLPSGNESLKLALGQNFRSVGFALRSLGASASACGITASTAVESELPAAAQAGTVPRSRNLNREKVQASLDTPCPKCGFSISPALIRRVDFDRVECPKCGEKFRPRSG